MKFRRFVIISISVLLLTIFAWNFPHSADSRLSARHPDRSASLEHGVRELSTPESYRAAWEANAGAAGDRGWIIARAELRRDEFMLLMREKPDEALGQAIGISDYVNLPDELKPFFERPFSARGDIDLLWETSMEGCDGHADCRKSHRTCIHRNTVTLGNMKLLACNEPKRHLPVLKDVPLAGVRLQNQVVISNNSVVRVAPEDFEAAASLFPEGARYNGESNENAALIAGKLHTMGRSSELVAVEKVLAEVKAHAVARRTSRVENPYAWLAGDSGGDEGADATPYQENQIDVLFIRVDFSDFSGAPISQADLETTLATVDGHLDNYSYGQAGITYTVTSQLYRMPSTGEDYATDSAVEDGIDGSDRIQRDARDKAAANYTLADYDVIAVYFPRLSGVSGSLITYGGFASIGGNRHWINGVNSVGVILHEFGHNYGLYHANYHHPEQQLGGTYQLPGILEYGDIFDEMGSGNSPEAHFSHLAKNYMQWMPDSKVAEATGNATYTIYRFDDINAISNPLLAVKVPMSGDVNYWIGYRQLYTSSSYNLSNAAYVVAENLASSRETSLIDMTPESTVSESDDRRDAGLPVGGTYYDSNAGVRFNALSKGGTAPNEWIQVQVVFDPRIAVAETNLDVDEQCGVARVMVQRQFSSVGTVSVDYATSDGSALSGSDYYQVSGTLTWADGDMSDKTIIIPVSPDVVAEGSEEFTLTLSGVIGGKIDSGASTATVTLLDAGQRITLFAPGFFNSAVYAIEPLGNGKVLVGGNIGSGIGAASDIRHFARLNVDGSVDTSFVTGTGFNNYVRDIAVQDDEKIVVGGDFTSYNGTTCNRVVRLNSDGTVDGSFVTAMRTAADGDVRSVAVEVSGTILVGGLFDNFAGSAANGLVRLNSSGVPAAALALPFSAGATVESVLAEPDGKITVGGNFTIGGTHRDIARLTSTGAQDGSFNAGSGSNGGIYSVARMSDGKYVLGGYFTTYNGTSAVRCCRINANGSLDNTFSNVGFDSSVRRVAAQPDGKTLAGGFFSAPANRLERLTSSGTVDGTFDQGTGPAGSVYEIALDDGGSIWVGGNFFSYNGSSSRPIVKLVSGISPYDIWVQTQFTADEIAAGDADVGQDPDEDGIVNLAEMAMGTNPVVANTDPVFSISENGGVTLQNSGGQDYLQITLDKTSLTNGAWFVAQFSSDLVVWSPANPTPAANASYDVIENSATKFVVRDKTPISTSAPRFGRIIIESPE